MASMVSVIICTRNRAGSLRETLLSIERCDLPAERAVEIIVVDNGSTDETATMIGNWPSTNMEIKYLSEPKGGKSAGLNLALSHARGEVLLFTDDDVRVPGHWIKAMSDPILSGEADAVQGGIRMAAHLDRAWMTVWHRAKLAEIRGSDGPIVLVGANMAVSRRVFEKVPGFDTEIGPGPAAGGEDSLFSWQIERLGFRIRGAFDVSLEHHFDPDRLSRRSFLDAAEKGGISDAYLSHHWDHCEVRWLRWKLWRAQVRLMFWRMKRWSDWQRIEGIADWEMNQVQDISRYRNLLIQRRHKRKYPRAASSATLSSNGSGDETKKFGTAFLSKHMAEMKG